MSGDASPRIHGYGAGELMLAYGPMNGPQTLVIQPLFEEMNRCRSLVAKLCRQLATRGIGCWLPDLPGTGESLRGIETTGWVEWRSAVVAAATVVIEASGRTPATIALRGGSLLDDSISGPHWRLSPTSGRSLLSDLRRSALAGSGDRDRPAGYPLPADLARDLGAAEPTEAPGIRTVRLASDDRPADHRVEGSPIWRRPEPVRDDALAKLLVEDIIVWSVS